MNDLELVIMTKQDNALRSHQRVFRINMLIGFIVTAIATYFIITGQYDGIQARQSTESLLSWVAITGMLYTVGFWFACLFRQQFFLKADNQP